MSCKRPRSLKRKQAAEERRVAEAEAAKLLAARLKAEAESRRAARIRTAEDRQAETPSLRATIREPAKFQAAIHRHVEVGSTLHTDEGGAHSGIANAGFAHATVNHSAGEYVRGDVTTNGTESFFAVFKRGLIGVYHHASPKHLDRYVDEFSFRLNAGNVKNHTFTRLESFVDGAAGKRLTYKALIK